MRDSRVAQIIETQNFSYYPRVARKLEESCLHSQKNLKLVRLNLIRARMKKERSTRTLSYQEETI